MKTIEKRAREYAQSLRNDFLYETAFIAYCRGARDQMAGDSEPIPITAKMLELNNFVRDAELNDWIYKIDGSSNHYVSVVIRRSGVNLEIRKHYTDVYARINYVYELQGALRFCGLKELADNWRVE